jgi:hypothetical protein
VNLVDSQMVKTIYKDDLKFITKVSRKKNNNRYVLSDLDHKQFQLINEDYWEFVVNQLSKPQIKEIRDNYVCIPSRENLFNELCVDIDLVNTLIIVPNRKNGYVPIPVKTTSTTTYLAEFHNNLYKSLTNDLPDKKSLEELITCDYLAKSGVLVYSKEFTKKKDLQINFEETLQDLVKYLSEKGGKFDLVLYKSATEDFADLQKFIEDNPEVNKSVLSIYLEDFNNYSVEGDWGYSNGLLYNNIPYHAV